jgi:hypothetical protein
VLYEPLLSLEMPEVATVSARRRTQELSTKVWDSLLKVLLSLERSSEGIRFLSARRGPAMDHDVKTQYCMIDMEASASFPPPQIRYQSHGNQLQPPTLYKLQAHAVF